MKISQAIVKLIERKYFYISKYAEYFPRTIYCKKMIIMHTQYQNRYLIPHMENPN